MKNRGPCPAHGSWFLCEAVVPPVSYLEVGTELLRTAAPPGATLRRASISVLFIRSTSGNDNPSAVAFGGRSLGGARGRCQTEAPWHPRLATGACGRVVECARTPGEGLRRTEREGIYATDHDCATAGRDHPRGACRDRGCVGIGRRDLRARFRRCRRRWGRGRACRTRDGRRHPRDRSGSFGARLRLWCLEPPAVGLDS